MFSGVPNMNDENFANNLSGVAIQFKLSNLEFKCATKESYFRKGLLRRIELICNLQGLMGKVGETKDIIKNVDIRFTRNVINNTNEMIQQAIQLSTIVSKETVLENLAGLIPDVQEELERLNTEREESIAFMQEEFNAQQPKQDEDEEEQDEDKE
jgi:SPP1 family phage portal protein